ncbi:unnamed protein product, partial [Adineta steineri]
IAFFKQKSQLFSRYLTTNIQPQLTTPTRQWAIKRYVLIIGLPVTSFLFYRLSTKSETRRKHRIVLESIGRAAHATSIGLRSAIDQKTSLLFKTEGTDEYTAALQASRRRNAKRFAHLCIDLGGVYVKIGQAFVRISKTKRFFSFQNNSFLQINLPEVIPVEYYEELQILQERALRREKGEIDTLFKRYFRNTPENVFATFNREPIAAASLAEVYSAETKQGERVAVKVQYSDLRERFETDITTVDKSK